MKLVPGKGLDLNQDHTAMMVGRILNWILYTFSLSFPNSVPPGTGSPVSKELRETKLNVSALVTPL